MRRVPDADEALMHLKPIPGSTLSGTFVPVVNKIRRAHTAGKIRDMQVVPRSRIFPVLALVRSNGHLHIFFRLHDWVPLFIVKCFIFFRELGKSVGSLVDHETGHATNKNTKEKSNKKASLFTNHPIPSP